MKLRFHGAVPTSKNPLNFTPRQDPEHHPAVVPLASRRLLRPQMAATSVIMGGAIS